MPRCCIAYTPDSGYLLPSLVSAIQARRHTSAALADVIIFGFGIDQATQDEFAPICRSEGVGFEAVGSEVLQGAPAMMARLFLNDFAPAEYTQYLYVDGDTQIVSSLDPLVQAELPPGRFMAANDPMTFQLLAGGGDSQRFAKHAERIGLSRLQAEFYFNTGVLRINRSGWDDIGHGAWQLAQRQKSIFRFPDQDPLNVVGAECHIPMSLAWNFPVFMRNARVEVDIKPSIYHFMSSPKPWQGSFMPWGAAAARPYRDIIGQYPVLGHYNADFSVGQLLRYHLQQRYKRASETVSWGFGARRGHILEYEAQISTALA